MTTKIRKPRKTRIKSGRGLEGIGPVKPKEKIVPVTPKKEDVDRKLAVFRVGPEWYGVDLDSVIEILDNLKIDSVPHLFEPFVGTVDLRGETLTLVNLRRLLKFEEPKEASEFRACLITLTGSKKHGLLVESEVEIVNFSDGKFYRLPDCYTIEEAKFLEGIFGHGDKLVGILKPEQALEVLIKRRKKDEER